MDFLSLQLHKLQLAGALLLSPSAIFSLPQLAVALLIAAVWLGGRQKLRRGAIGWAAIGRAMVSRRILFNRSTRADLFYYFINTFAISTLIGWALFSGLTVSAATVHGLSAVFGARAPSHAPGWVLRIALTIVAFLGYELGYYIDHTLKHKVPFLWEFHKTHHTAEVLTPLTVFRVHPLDTLLFFNITACVAGVAHGLFVWTAGRQVGVYMIDNANAITVVFLFALAQLQHSQFWIPLRGLPGRLLLSPAHHQIHHSVDPEHYNRNLGSFLAIWDWMFGTLWIPQAEPQRLKFGVSDPGQDPHRLETLLVSPMANSLRAIGLGRRERDIRTEF